MKSKENENNKEIIKTWLTGQHSCKLIIPKDFAKEYGLDEPSHVIVEGTSNGILIRKLKI
ncbi:MAG: AbrB/MazE/SpoVT family DNA-binding domain-containing protein [Candidatus Nitrosocosmicus sp.]|nr:AbrB/MazE/SpoVT family DNA-binding domain-containing protein [Candidatus Nitrosocosmicus sp.]